MGLPKSIEEKLTSHSQHPDLELIGCARATVDDVMVQLAPDRINVVVIDSSQTWAAGLARALRAHQKELRLLILANPTRLTGYIVYDFDRCVENAGEAEVIGAIEAAAEGRSFVRP